MHLFGDYLMYNFYIMHYQILEHNQSIITLSRYEHKKDQTFLTMQQTITDISQMNIALNTPFVLMLTGKGIIEKNITDAEEKTNEEWLKTIAPMASLQNFFIDKQYGVDNRIIKIAAARKTLVENIIQIMIDKKIKITTILLGEREVFNEVFLSNFLSYSINESPLIIRKNNENFTFQQKSKKLLVIGLIGFFLLLTLNTIVFFILNKNIAKYDEIINQNSKLLQTEADLNKEYIDKTKLVSQAGGIAAKSFHALMIDDILTDLPANISFQQFEINKKREDTDTLLFINNIINIIGNTPHSYTLNEWINNLKKKQWIKTVELKNFKQDENSAMGIFEVQITY